MVPTNQLLLFGHWLIDWNGFPINWFNCLLFCSRSLAMKSLKLDRGLSTNARSVVNVVPTDRMWWTIWGYTLMNVHSSVLFVRRSFDWNIISKIICCHTREKNPTLAVFVGKVSLVQITWWHTGKLCIPQVLGFGIKSCAPNKALLAIGWSVHVGVNWITSQKPMLSNG